jgi:hypothetical protein
VRNGLADAVDRLTPGSSDVSGSRRTGRSGGSGRAAAQAKSSAGQAKRWVVMAGRVGVVSFGVVHLLIAWLALQVAFGSGKEADQKGAVATIAAQPFGMAMLIVLIVGLIAFGLWLLYAAVAGFGYAGDKRTGKRVGAAGRAVGVFAVAAAAIQTVSGSGSGGGNQSQQTATAKLLTLPMGKALVVIVGLVIIGVGVKSVLKGVRKTFMEDLDTSRLSAASRRSTERLGQVGYSAKGVAVGIVGLLFGFAGFTADPNKAGGLDAALKTLRDAPFGMFLLILVALGFLAFGVYCFFDARCRRS